MMLNTITLRHIWCLTLQLKELWDSPTNISVLLSITKVSYLTLFKKEKCSLFEHILYSVMSQYIKGVIYMYLQVGGMRALICIE